MSGEMTGEMSGAATDRAAAVWEAMRTLVLDRYDRRAEVRAELGMSFFRVKALRHVAQGSLTMRELVDALGSDAPYVSVVVDDLAKRGYVERNEDPADRRRKIVSVTPAGAEVAARADDLLNQPPAALTALDDAELAMLQRTLARLAD
jgi:DNA-binding MarR family transcriptional regulator